MYTITIISINQHKEIEWTEKITSNTSLRAAKSKATKWIKNNFFGDVKIDKVNLGKYADRWYLLP